MSGRGPVVVATDLTEASRPALLSGRAYAQALEVPLVVCHVVLDVFRSHPLIPNPQQNDLLVGSKVRERAGELTTKQVVDVLGMPNDTFSVHVESGTPEEEIVRLAEASGASLIVVGAKPREGVTRVLGHVAERVVRYAPGSVLVARAQDPERVARNLLVATDFTEGSLPALAVAGEMVKRTAASATLLHAIKSPSSLLPSALMPLGDTWTPPAAAAVDELAALGRRTLEGFVKEYGFTRGLQVEGDPADVILEQARALDVDMIVMGSRGRRGLTRLVLGSVSEKVIRNSDRSVLIARAEDTGQ